MCSSFTQNMEKVGPKLETTQTCLKWGMPKQTRGPHKGIPLSHQRNALRMDSYRDNFLKESCK